MTMPHLENCRHGAYGICEMCAEDFAAKDGWISSASPPNSMRPVHLQFSDGTEDQGFFVHAENQWYLSAGGEVNPTHWADGETLRQLLQRVVSDNDIGLMA